MSDHTAGTVISLSQTNERNGLEADFKANHSTKQSPSPLAMCLAFPYSHKSEHIDTQISIFPLGKTAT